VGAGKTGPIKVEGLFRVRPVGNGAESGRGLVPAIDIKSQQFQPQDAPDFTPEKAKAPSKLGAPRGARRDFSVQPELRAGRPDRSPARKDRGSSWRQRPGRSVGALGRRRLPGIRRPVGSGDRLESPHRPLTDEHSTFELWYPTKLCVHAPPMSACPSIESGAGSHIARGDVPKVLGGLCAAAARPAALSGPTAAPEGEQDFIRDLLLIEKSSQERPGDVAAEFVDAGEGLEVESG